MNVVLLQTNEHESTVQVSGLEDMQKLVGGYIEMLRGSAYCMIFNEEGKLKNLPINQIATVMAREESLIFPSDVIVGDVFFCKVSSRTGEFVGLNTQSRVIILGRIARIATDISVYFASRFSQIVDELQGG